MKKRYDNKRVFRKTTISQAEYDKITDEAVAAEELLTQDRFSFIRDILTSAKDYASTSIIENTIMDVSEETTITDKVKKILHLPKKVQVDELSGQYKLVKKFFEELNEYVELKKNLDSQISSGNMEIDEPAI